MKQFRVGLDLPPRRTWMVPGTQTAPLSVAVDIGAHVQFELVLCEFRS